MVSFGKLILDQFILEVVAFHFLKQWGRFISLFQLHTRAGKLGTVSIFCSKSVDEPSSLNNIGEAYSCFFINVKEVKAMGRSQKLQQNQLNCYIHTFCQLCPDLRDKLKMYEYTGC